MAKKKQDGNDAGGNDAGGNDAGGNDAGGNDAGGNDADAVAELDFEAALSKLEDAVRRLEAGDLNLAESLAVFEEGIAVSRRCTMLLEQARGRVEKLVSREGGLEAVPLDEEP